MDKIELDYWYLRNHKLFCALAEDEIKSLLAISNFTSHSKGSIIYSLNTAIGSIYLLLKGRIKIACVRPDLPEVLLEILKEDDIFGELNLNTHENNQHEFAEVLSAGAITCSFSTEQFKEVLTRMPEVHVLFSCMIAEKLQVISKKYCDVILKDARKRVINFFMLHAKYEGKWIGDRAEINMYCTHKDIAGFTAAKRQTVTTIINNLVKEQVIIYQGRSKVIIPDVKKLERE